MTIEIYQTFHREFPYNKNCKWITPVAVGNYYNPDMIRDDTGDSIAHLNSYFGEFSTMYWVWKNRPLADIVGFYHYRRYLHLRSDDTNFDWMGKIDKGTHYQVDLVTEPHMLDFITSDEYRDRIEVMFESTDAITGFPMRFDCTIPQQWQQHHPMPAFYLFLEALKKHFPLYKDKIDAFFQGYGQIYWPIMILRRQCFEKFCSDMFPILFDVFEKIGTPYDPYQNRYVCFLVERFIPMWFILQRINPSTVSTMTFFTDEVPLVPGQIIKRGSDGKISGAKAGAKSQKGF
jgi:hypothetical protein